MRLSLLTIIEDSYAAGRANGVRGTSVEEMAEELDDCDVFAYAGRRRLRSSTAGRARSWSSTSWSRAATATAQALWAVSARARRWSSGCTRTSRPTIRSTSCWGSAWRRRSHLTRWMLRLLDVQAALSGRGYPGGARAGGAARRATTRSRGQRAGRIGCASAAAAASWSSTSGCAVEPTRCGRPGGLAALYAGTSTASLRRRDCSAAVSPHDDALDVLFVGRPAYMLDYF